MIKHLVRRLNVHNFVVRPLAIKLEPWKFWRHFNDAKTNSEILMQRPYDLKYERKLTNAVSWPCWKGNIREWMSSLAVFWKETIWIELQRCWPHIRVSVKSKSRNSNRSSFGSCVPIWKAILSYVKLRAYKQNLLVKLSQSSNSKTTTKTKQTNP